MKKFNLDFNYELCKACSLCVEFCPKKILYLDKDKINKHGYNIISVTDMDKCIGCMFCATMCPDSVIGIKRITDE